MYAPHEISTAILSMNTLTILFRAIVKSTAKETGKAILDYEPPDPSLKDNTRRDGVG